MPFCAFFNKNNSVHSHNSIFFYYFCIKLG